ncbi:hypothetical protein FV217_13205 [Methylobacterium sp. WL9]|nr:hypothetical protein FV217_13205 [Methylobacterium sp. WL9]
MSVKTGAALFALATTIASPMAAFGQGGGGPGCTNLPEYNRALGALQGMTSACDMTLEEACRIVAARGTPAAACQQIALKHSKRRRGSGLSSQ